MTKHLSLWPLAPPRRPPPHGEGWPLPVMLLYAPARGSHLLLPLTARGLQGPLRLPAQPGGGALTVSMWRAPPRAEGYGDLV